MVLGTSDNGRGWGGGGGVLRTWTHTMEEGKEKLIVTGRKGAENLLLPWLPSPPGDTPTVSTRK